LTKWMFDRNFRHFESGVGWLLVRHFFIYGQGI
jgi:hypothetical protein